MTLTSGNTFEVNFFEAHRLRQQLTVLLKPTQTRDEVRNKWKQIVSLGYKLKR